MSAEIMPFTVLKGGRRDRRATGQPTKNRRETVAQKFRRLAKLDPNLAEVFEMTLDDLLAQASAPGWSES